MNNLYSMTGFASTQAEYNNNEITCEIRALNSRYLEISIRLPKVLSDLENSIKDLIRQKITRGKIMYSLNFSSLSSELQNLKIDPDTIQIYMNLLKEMKKAAHIDAKITLDHLLSFKDIISFEEEAEIDEEFAKFIFRVTEDALQNLDEMRSQEGDFLRKDLQSRMGNILQLTDEIAQLGKNNARNEFEKMYKRLLSLVGDEKQMDSNRFEQELAIIADKVDITEESVRLKSHIQLFEENLKEGSPVGKKLNFILQEMNRETNTISNKTTMVEISHRVVALKEEIEKIREQVQNIE